MNSTRQRGWLRHLVSRVARLARIGLGTEGLIDAAVAQAAQTVEIVERLTRIDARTLAADQISAGSAERVCLFRVPGGPAYSLLVTKIGDDPYRTSLASNGGQEPDWHVCIGLLRPGETFFDLGANIGAFSIPAAALGVEVHAFELLADNAATILASARLNGSEALKVVQGAVWDCAGAVGVGGFSAWGTVQLGVQTMVAAMTIDDYVAQHAVGRIHVMKLDVEGAERAALSGASAVIERDHPDIVFESNTLTCGGAGYSYRTLMRLMRQFGYRIFRVGPNVLHPWCENDVQEVVKADFLATRKSDAEILARCGWSIRPLTAHDVVESILGEDKYSDYHRMHVLAISEQLPADVGKAEPVARLLREWHHLLDNPNMAAMKTGVSSA